MDSHKSSNEDTVPPNDPVTETTNPAQVQNGPMTRSRFRALQQTQGARPTSASNTGNSTLLLPGLSQSHRASSKHPATGGGGGDAPQPKFRRKDNTQSSQSSVLSETLVKTRALVEQQNEAFQKSLEADKEKERIKQENAKAREELRNRQLEAEQNLPKPPEDNEDGIISIVIRLPCGKTYRRNFRPTDNLYCLRNFVMSQEGTPLLFEITRYPNEVVPAPDPADDAEQKGFITLQEHGFKNKELLHVRERLEKKIPNLFRTQSELTQQASKG